VKVGDEGYHVIGGDEGIVNGNEFHIVSLKSHPGHQTPNSSKSCYIKLKLNLKKGENGTVEKALN